MTAEVKILVTSGEHISDALERLAVLQAQRGLTLAKEALEKAQESLIAATNHVQSLEVGVN